MATPVAPARPRPSGVTLAVLAGLAGIACSVAVVAASYDATILGPGRSQATPIAALARVQVAVAPATAASGAVAVPKQQEPAQTSGATLNVAAAGDVAVVAALPASVAVAPITTPVVAVPTPHLRPAVPPAPPRQLASGTQVRQAPTAPWWAESRQPAAATETGSATVNATPSASPSSHDGDAGRSDQANADRDGGNRGGGNDGKDHGNPGKDDAISVDDALKSVDRLLSSLPPANIGSNRVASIVVQAPGTHPPNSAVPLPPAPIPAVIAGAPATGRSGQLVFPIPQTVIVVPASVVRAPGGEVGPRIARVVTPPVPLKPHLRRSFPQIPG